MKWHLATPDQLKTILTEDCPVDYHYRAVLELQERKYKPKTDNSLQKIVSLFGQGLLISEIAKIVNLSDYKVQRTVEKYGLWKVRLYNELRKTEPTHRGGATSYYNGKRAVL
jgi:hypothetical protein